FDVSTVVRWDAPNVLAVRTSNAADGLPPISADFTFFGGLYRGVEIFATDPVHIDPLDFGADAVYIAQEKVSAERADTKVRVGVRNDSAQAMPVTIRIALNDSTGKSVA